MDGVCHLNACRLILYSWMTILNYSRVGAVEIHGSRLPYSMAPASVPVMLPGRFDEVHGLYVPHTSMRWISRFPNPIIFWVCMVFPGEVQIQIQCSLFAWVRHIEALNRSVKMQSHLFFLMWIIWYCGNIIFSRYTCFGSSAVEFRMFFRFYRLLMYFTSCVCFFCSESHVRRLKSPEGSTHHYLYTP
jgi:hypothetical protein